MYTENERQQYFQEIVLKLSSNSYIEGIIHIGSGTKGYTDCYSDIDLMVATNEDVIEAKECITEELKKMGAYFIKEGKFAENIFLLIPFFPNALEMNISVLPVHSLSVKSPLWKVLFDRNGNVTEKMEEESEAFHNTKSPYIANYDISFEFAYTLRKLRIEVARQNFIYAMKMLENLRELTLNTQVLNEKKKLHQFKAFHTLNNEFLNNILASYPTKVEEEEILKCAKVLSKLFKSAVNSNDTFEYNEELLRIANLK